MRRFLSLIPLVFLIPMGVSAIAVSCGSIPDASGCQQCFRFDLADTNAASNIFIPRTGIPAGQQEYIDLSRSSISGYVYQGVSVSPTGNITSSFDLLANAPNATAPWVWAKTKAGQSIVRGNIPATFDYTKPAYALKFQTLSFLKNQSNVTVVANTEVTHRECSFFYIPTPQAACGNGRKEGTEQCDDGNTNNIDTCTNACRLPICGNSIRESNEQCDDGNTNSNDACSNACRLPVCGNAIREGSEQCDDGNTRDGDACTSQCRNPGVTSVCGNGVREGNEQCDDGNSSNTDTCSTQCLPINNANPQCRVQAFDSFGSVPLTTTLSCSGEPRGRTAILITSNNALIDTSETTSKTFTFNKAGRYTVRCYPDAANQSNTCSTVINVDGQCGNGLIESGEQCDDGNTISGDQCDRSCRLSGSTCGNGMLENDEQCDDGNNSNNDTCTNFCQTGTPPTGPLGIILLLALISLAGAVGIIAYRTKRKAS